MFFKIAISIDILLIFKTKILNLILIYNQLYPKLDPDYSVIGDKTITIITTEDHVYFSRKLTSGAIFAINLKYLECRKLIK